MVGGSAALAVPLIRVGLGAIAVARGGFPPLGGTFTIDGSLAADSPARHDLRGRIVRLARRIMVCGDHQWASHRSRDDAGGDGRSNGNPDETTPIVGAYALIRAVHAGAAP